MSICVVALDCSENLRSGDRIIRVRRIINRLFILHTLSPVGACGVNMMKGSATVWKQQHFSRTCQALLMNFSGYYHYPLLMMFF